jgi:monoamine oxidase
VKAKNAFVVGGGIAGLGAARELLRGGCRVRLFEAKPRLGGRIHTEYHEGVPLELGAEFLHGRHQGLWQLFQPARLEPQAAASLNRVKTGARFEPVDILSKVGRAFAAAEIQKPDLSCAEFLGGLPLGEGDCAQVTAFLEGFHAAPATRLSTHSICRAEYSAAQMEGQAQFRIGAGYASLIRFLEHEVRHLGGEVCLGSCVRWVDWKPGKVDLFVAGDGAEGAHQADAAVIALPLGVLKVNDVQFRPSLRAKREAIEDLEVGTVVKVLLHFRERWWEGADFGFVHAYEEPFATWWSTGFGATLVGWAGGPAAQQLAGLSQVNVEALALDVAARVFDQKRQRLEFLLLRCCFHDWLNDHHIRGAYSYIPVGALDAPKLLGAPLQDTLFFAGEAVAADAQTGMVFNAYESGVTAARQLLAAWN